MYKMCFAALDLNGVIRCFVWLQTDRHTEIYKEVLLCLRRVQESLHFQSDVRMFLAEMQLTRSNSEYVVVISFIELYVDNEHTRDFLSVCTAAHRTWT